MGENNNEKNSRDYNKFMRKHIKLILLVFVIIIGASFFAINSIRKPVKINKEFNDAIISENHKDIKKLTNVRIDAEYYKWKAVKGHLINHLTGKLYIDEEEYNFSAVEVGEAPNKYLFGTVKREGKDVLYLYMLDNMKTVFLGETEFQYFIAAPAATIEEYLKIKSKLPK